MDGMGLEQFFVGLLALASLGIAVVALVVLRGLFKGQR